MNKLIAAYARVFMCMSGGEKKKLLQGADISTQGF